MHQPGIWRSRRRGGNSRREEPEQGEDGLGNPGNKLAAPPQAHARQMLSQAAACHCKARQMLHLSRVLTGNSEKRNSAAHFVLLEQDR